jgi:hypothetical protein
MAYHPAAAPPAYTTHARRSVSRPICFRIWYTTPTPRHNIQLSFIEVPTPPDDGGVPRELLTKLRLILAQAAAVRFPLAIR